MRPPLSGRKWHSYEVGATFGRAAVVLRPSRLRRRELLYRAARLRHGRCRTQRPALVGRRNVGRLPDHDIPTYWLTRIITVIPLGHRPLRARVRRSEGHHAPDEWPTAGDSRCASRGLSDSSPVRRPLDPYGGAAGRFGPAGQHARHVVTRGYRYPHAIRSRAGIGAVGSDHDRSGPGARRRPGHRAEGRHHQRHQTQQGREPPRHAHRVRQHPATLHGE